MYQALEYENTDNKIIASANCIALNPDFIKITHKTQNGFTQGRNFLNNLVDVDSARHMHSMLYDDLKSTSPEDIPIAGAYDLEAAFPSVIHDWIWLVLHHRKMLPDYIRVFPSLSKNAFATYEHNGGIYVFIRFLSGARMPCFCIFIQ